MISNNWSPECGKSILFVVVDIARFKFTAKNPECQTTNTPYLKVVGITGSEIPDLV